MFNFYLTLPLLQDFNLIHKPIIFINAIVDKLDIRKAAFPHSNNFFYTKSDLLLNRFIKHYFLDELFCQCYFVSALFFNYQLCIEN